MRLNTINMAGFKSFVDPTHFHSPSNLTGIVGPNGCGKSNIIDAVRWVMGEGSAKVLRGESMADVIFAGSSARKPVGTATVELVFDNSEGRFGGQYASFGEISVKRQVSRDGVSLYYLNGTRCRRKDIRDLFLGTGLGSSSYSIIEQGMISEIVDARPDDIRGHLEEAAGISRYKERRRETESRIARTRENLARLSDVREEVSKHLARLKRQANAAQRYQKLKQQKRDLESKQLALQWRELSRRIGEGAKDLAARETRLQERIAAQRRAERALEELHQAQASAGEDFGKIQGELYDAGSEIARLEQAIEHERELQQRRQQDYEETGAALADIEKHMVLDKAQVEELTRSLAEVEPALAAATDEEMAAERRLAEAEERVLQWQKAFEEHHRNTTECQREADRSRAQIQRLDERLLDAARRIEALKEESGSVDSAELVAGAAEIEEQAGRLAAELKSEQSRLDEMLQRQAGLQKEQKSAEAALEQAREKLNRCAARLESLTALQRAMQEDDAQAEWLSVRGLSDAPRLAASITVERGWEAAVEAVLGHFLQSLLVADIEASASGLQDLSEAAVALMESGEARGQARAGTLAARVDGPAAVRELLSQVRTAESLEAALRHRSGLESGQSLITAGGVWVGKNWIRVSRKLAGGSGALVREKDIAALRAEFAQLEAQAAAHDQALASARAQRDRLEPEIREQQEQLNRLHRQHAVVEAGQESRQASIGMMDSRSREIAREMEQLRGQVAADEADVREARATLETRLEAMAGLERERKELESKRQALMASRDEARKAMREARERRHELALKARSNQASLDSLRQTLERMDGQVSQLQQRYLNLSEQMAKNKPPEKLHEKEMAALLQRRLETEARLGQAREKLQSLEDDYRKQDSSRQEAVQKCEELRADLERARLGQQEIEFKARSLAEQVAGQSPKPAPDLSSGDPDDKVRGPGQAPDRSPGQGGDIAQIAGAIPEDASSADWAQEMEDLQERIVRLEPVNLAAIQEYEEESKRKEYLDSQNEDLCEALATLENAIAKIDRKTRTRFKETFEQVNKGLQELFPRLFGGGHAYLELTGEDLLTTGVSIMARPPGKRVSSIHLLSGGEKALTAVAFVFAIFMLNPAPFCLLDEVDAPLDDANVVRFAALVNEMAENVQFIVVTHNKTTMEMIHQLSGVTMREPGVSRLVQVDVEEAARLAAV